MCVYMCVCVCVNINKHAISNVHVFSNINTQLIIILKEITSGEFILYLYVCVCMCVCVYVFVCVCVCISDDIKILITHNVEHCSLNSNILY